MMYCAAIASAQEQPSSPELSKLDRLIAALETTIESDGDFRLDEAATEALGDEADTIAPAEIAATDPGLLPVCLIDVSVDGFDDRILSVGEAATALGSLVGLHKQTTELLSIEACDAGAMPTVEQMSANIASVDVGDLQQVLVMTEGCLPAEMEATQFTAKRRQLLDSFRSFMTASSEARGIVEECGL